MNAHTDEKHRVARASLSERAGELRDRLRRVEADLGRQRDPMPRDFADGAIRVENDEVLEAIAESARVELRRIEAALERIEAGQFALCERCGATIGPERRAAVPYATDCAHCAIER
jgi:DnaK suppressor protein